MSDMFRKPSYAGTFYPIDRDECINQIQKFTKAQFVSEFSGQILGGIVPHAGWIYSGRLAAAVFQTIKGNLNPETIVLFGTPHHTRIGRPVMYDRGAWNTPLGDVLVDDELSNEILRNSGNKILISRDAHYGEHSIEVQLPLIKYYFPESKILPVLISPNEFATEAGSIIGSIISKYSKNSIVVGSSDLTHYGLRYYGYEPAGTGKSALEWSKNNDMRVVKLMLQMEAEHIIPEAIAHNNACGAGSIAATIAATKVLGANKGKLLDYMTSQEVYPEKTPTDFVGYAAIVFYI